MLRRKGLLSIQTLLILAPHQDDECLQTAGVIRNAVAQGGRVCVCFATNGEYEGDEFAAIRAAESRAVLKELGVSHEDIFFLGYADAGMSYKDSFLQQLYCDLDCQAQSRWGHTSAWTPDDRDYGFLRRGRHSSYTAQGVRRDLNALLAEVLPDEIYVSAPGDSHGDHDALGRFATEAVDALRETQPEWKPTLYYYLIHGDETDAWPDRREEFFSLPEGGELPPGQPEHRPLPKDFPPEEKRRLISLYVSQKPEAYNDYLLAFAKREELLFRRSAD